jgi:hypothetical protein
VGEYWRAFIACLAEATSLIDAPHFTLAVAGGAKPTIRERVYCYELYHHLRSRLPSIEEFPFRRHGEVDKRGHPVLGKKLKGRNPDFIVHKPGEMGPEANLATIEVKACGLPGKIPTKDAESLAAFIEEADYFGGIGLVFGGNEDDLNRHIKIAFGPEARKRDRIVIMWHHTQGQAARNVENWWARL